MSGAQLLPSERERLVSLEKVLDRGLAVFVEVGTALQRIRDERLYRETHATFEDYCRERWSLSKPYASQIIVGSETVAIATAEGLPAPRNEAVARKLAGLRSEPARLREAWSTAVERHGPAPTAAQTREVVRGEIADDAPTVGVTGIELPAGDGLQGASGPPPTPCDGVGPDGPIAALIDALAALDQRLDQSAVFAAWSEADDEQRADLDDALSSAISALSEIQRRARQTTWADPERLLEGEPAACSGSMYDPAGDFA
jgi:hypothetical protein